MLVSLETDALFARDLDKPAELDKLLSRESGFE